MTKIYSRLSCLAIFCAIFPSSFALADDPCSDASSVDCITITGVRAGQQLSAYAAAQQQAAYAAIAAEQARAAEAQRLGYEAMLRARAEAEAKALATQQAAAQRKQPTKLECKTNNLNTRKSCIRGADTAFGGSQSECNYYLWLAGGAGILAAGTSETVAGGLGFGSAAVAFGVKATTCQQAADMKHSQTTQACSDAFDEWDLKICETL